ncbi:NTPase [Prevotella intermedia]|uniref:NTPase n=1 Tax=Prevotella intermedia TaxID=28131 RepID=A0A2D3L5T0_PREIN|nr:NTPase [Prevotella intermedia]ATV25938.1 NTPase [Prevotella intermedia]
MNIEELNNLFHIYGYELKEEESSYRVYLLHHGMYYGAEIIILDNFDSHEISERYSKLGYSVKVQHFKTIEEVENYLFKGFFKTEYTALAIEHRYDDFVQKQMKQYASSKIKYEYINVPYAVSSDENTGVLEHKSIIDFINEYVNKKGANLIIVEAAAGFGKTCTAFELYHSFSRFSDNAKPLFTELSRNREAKLFKYVLWSEIENEYQSSISNALVTYNIKSGRIPLIIDGFDELLTKNIDSGGLDSSDDFEQVETMLSTIGDLLQGNAKVILTSRKTAIFAGSEFYEWTEKYNHKFEVVRFLLEKPNVKQWLRTDRYNIIKSKNIPLDYIANPVLLTYLRNVDKEEFLALIEVPEKITQKYFEYLLNRERERQNLFIPYKEQMLIFENLARTFMAFNIKGEEREFVKEMIMEYNRQELIRYKELSPVPQSVEELADTLTNHALLDRIGNNDNIGFVNEFIFGYILGNAIISGKDLQFKDREILPIDLLEFSVLAFQYSSYEEKKKLWNRLSPIKSMMDVTHSLQVDSILLKSIYGNYKQTGITSFFFVGTSFLKENCQFCDFSFIDISFDSCAFDIKVFKNVVFTGCSFKNCSVVSEREESDEVVIFCYGCDDFSDGFLKSFIGCKMDAYTVEEHESLEMQVLSKYFKVDGKSTKMRYISHLLEEFEKSKKDAFKVFDKLRRDGYINTRGNNSFITQTGISYYHKQSLS